MLLRICVNGDHFNNVVVCMWKNAKKKKKKLSVFSTSQFGFHRIGVSVIYKIQLALLPFVLLFIKYFSNLIRMSDTLKNNGSKRGCLQQCH